MSDITWDYQYDEASESWSVGFWNNGHTHFNRKRRVETERDAFILASGLTGASYPVPILDQILAKDEGQ